MSADTAPFRDRPLSEVPLEVLQTELARLRAMPPMERLAAGRFLSDAERLTYARGRIAGRQETRARAPRWLGSVPHELPCEIEGLFYERIVYPSRRLWRRLTGCIEEAER